MLEMTKTLCSCANFETRYTKTHVCSNTDVLTRIVMFTPCLILEKDDTSNILEL